MLMNSWWLAAGVSGSLMVALGAFGAHVLKDRLDARGQDLWRTAVLYQGLHLAPLLALGLASECGSWTCAAGWAFILGTVLFSGSLYALSLGAPRRLGAVTPLGGLALIAGWILLLIQAL